MLEKIGERMKKETPRLYEGMYILSASLSEDARKKALEKITNGIVSKKGEVHKIHDMGKKRFAYEIKKKKEGFYYLIYFTLEASFLEKIKQEYHFHEDLLRYMILQADEVREKLEFKSVKVG